MVLNHSVFPCAAFPFSNDRWTEHSVSTLKEMLSRQTQDVGDSAALVVGAGTLPFTLPTLPPRIFVADMAQSVLDKVTGGLSSVGRFNSWEEYRVGWAGDSVDGQAELERALGTGLAGDFEDVQAAVARSSITPVLGDIVLKAPEIGQTAIAEGKKFTFINFTNVARYLGSWSVDPNRRNASPNGRTVLASLLGRLPVHPEAVICDSFRGLRPEFYAPDEYIKLFGDRGTADSV